MSVNKVILSKIPTLIFIFGLFVSSTYAWFGSTIENNNNFIQSGKLDVGFYSSDMIVNGDLAGNIINLAHQNSNLFVFNEANRSQDFIEKFIKVKNEGSIPINYQVNFEVTQTSLLENVIRFEFQYLNQEIIHVSAADLESNAYISLQDNVPEQGGLRNFGYEIWRVRMYVNENFDLSVNQVGLTYSFNLRLRAWHFNYPLSSVIYHIDFITNDGNPINRQYYVVNETLNLPEATRTGYIFSGWYVDQGLTQPLISEVMPRNHLQLYAKWETVIYTITYDLNEGIFTVPAKVTYTINDQFDLAVPERLGYTFLGWYQDDIFSNYLLIDAIRLNSIGNINLYARWGINEYQIRYLTNGNRITTESFIYDTNLELHVPTRFGFTFSGWYEDSLLSNRFIETKMPAASFDLHAKWTPAPLTFINNTSGSDMTSFGYTADGALYAWGHQARKYIDGTLVNLHRPTYIPLLGPNGENIILKEFSQSNGFLLSTDGKLYKLTNQVLTEINFDLSDFGLENYIIHRIDDTSSDLFLILDNGRLFKVRLSTNLIVEIFIASLAIDEFIIDAESGFDHTILLTNKGNIYGFGSNSHGQVGVGGQNTPSMSTIAAPTKINLSNITKISAHRFNSYAINEIGQVFSWGNNINLGTGYNFGFHAWTPSRIIIPNLGEGEQVISVENGDSHGLAVTNHGRLFSWGGSGSYSARGTDSNSYYTPQLITLNLTNNEKIIQVVGGRGFSLFLSSEGRIFGAGSNVNGNLAQGSATSDFTLPVLALPSIELI